MEHSCPLTTKLSSQGLLLQISPKPLSKPTIHYEKKNNYQNVYTNCRVNKDLSNILKFRKLPDSLIELAKISHDFYSQKHASPSKETASPDSLRALLNLFPPYACSDIEGTPSEVTFSSHKFCHSVPINGITDFLEGKELTQPEHYEVLKQNLLAHLVSYLFLIY